MPRGYKADGSFAGVVFKKGHNAGNRFKKGEPRPINANSFPKGHHMNVGRKLSEAHKIKMGLYNRGSSNKHWKGGRSSLIRKEIKAGRKRPDLCEICGRSDRICFDHCHKTGKFRGWICRSCNLALGYVDDKVEILEKIINYIKNYEVQNS